ncbi:MAG TPA: DUF1615 family protein, partial [Polyangia bacterium]|nr:DUF1615 family protein [Polyangia bacterium]
MNVVPRVAAVLLLGLGCGPARAPVTAGTGPRLEPAGIAALIDHRVKEREAWGQAVSEALRASGLPPDPPSVCAVLAIIGQESGFQEDPVVPGLARVVEARLEHYRSKLGPLGRPVFARLLDGHAPGDARSFEVRLQKVRTERDLDRVFRDLLAFYQSGHPAAYEAATLAGKLFDLQSLADLNPITTAGPMQVSVRFAEGWAREHGRPPAEVREALYTRAGGVLYGTARLFGHRAGYSKMIFRFADYNAGVYTSRNAALQAQLSKVVGMPLALDGDLLRYEKDGTPSDDDSKTVAALKTFRQRFAPALSEDQL